MFDIMDWRFHKRWILISNIYWIFVLLHFGVNSNPTLNITGSGQLGTEATFTCVASGPDQFYAVFKKGVKIALVTASGLSRNNSIEKPYANRVILSNSKLPGNNIYSYMLKLDNVQCSDEGNYTCTVNMAGNLETAMKPFSINTLHQEPNLKAPTDFVVVDDTVTLQCTANVGKPPRNLSLCIWQEQGFNCSEMSNLVDLGDCSYTRTAEMTVTVTEDTNQATCEVLDPAGNNLKVIKTWPVYYPVVDIKFVPDDPSVTLTEGSSMMISCEARGKPFPSYRWEFQSKDDSLNSAVWLQDAQDLHLRNVRLDQNGVYSCIATNNIRNVTYNMTKSIIVNVVPTTPAPTTTPSTTTPMKSSSDTNTPKTGPKKNDDGTDWGLIGGIIAAILILIIILIILFVILYRRRSKPAEIEEPPEKPRNNHEVNMKEMKPDLVYSTGIEKGKLPRYNTGFDHNGEDDLYYAELAFDDKPRSRKPVVPLYDHSTSNGSYPTVMPQV